MLEGCVPWPEDVAARYVAAGHWRGQPLGALLSAWADAWPERLALVDGDSRWSYRELADAADVLAGRLAGLGLRAPDRVVVQLPNTAELVLLTLACLRLGVLPVMALPPHRRSEIGYLAAHAAAAAYAGPDVLRGFDHAAMAREVARDVPSLRHLLLLGEPGPGEHDLRALAREPGGPGAAAAARRRLDADPPDPRDVALFLLSGGTTGLPKLIPRTHDDYAYNLRTSAEVCGFDAGTVYLVALPASHNFPLACPGLLGTFDAGGTVVLIPGPEPTAAYDAIARHGVTHTAVVPAVAQRWLDHSAATGIRPEPLRVLQVGGARLAPEQARRVTPLLGARLQQVFGMAEGLLDYTRLDDPDEVVEQTQGRPMSSDDELRVVDADDRDLPDGEPGTLLTRGPYTLRGYYRAAEHNARAFTADGWYRTGDVVRRRPDGNLVVEGRTKDLVNRGGEKISAEEVEDLVYAAAPGVALAACVAAPDPTLGERIAVYVVLREGAAPLDLDTLRAGIEDRGVARFKLPERLEVLEEMPLTHVGKLDKKALRERLGEVPA